MLIEGFIIAGIYFLGRKKPTAQLRPTIDPLKTTSPAAIEQATQTKIGPVPVLGVKQQSQICEIADAEFRVITKIYPVPPNVSQAWFSMPCSMKSAFVAGYALPPLGPTGVLIAFMLQDAEFSERFRAARTTSLKRVGLYDIAKRFAQATNPVYKAASGVVVEAAKIINKLPF